MVKKMIRKEKNEKDIKYILENLRDEDKKEALTVRGENFVDGLLKDIMQSQDVNLGVRKKDGLPICVGGCTETEEKGVGIVWLLCTKEIENHQVCLIKHLIRYFKEYEKKYWLTFNYIFEENYLAKNWLKKFGYVFVKDGLNIPDKFEMFFRKRKTRGLE